MLVYIDAACGAGIGDVDCWIWPTQDKDGKLSAKEFAVLCKDVWSLDEKKSATILKKFDTDSDGYMGLKDLTKMLVSVATVYQSSFSPARGIM